MAASFIIRDVVRLNGRRVPMMEARSVLSTAADAHWLLQTVGALRPVTGISHCASPVLSL